MQKPMQSKFLPLDPNEYVLRSDAERFARESVEEALAEERARELPQDRNPFNELSDKMYSRINRTLAECLADFKAGR